VKNFYTFNIFYKVFITVECLNLALKVKVLGPLLRIRGVGGHRYSIVYIVWGYCGWVGGPASLQAYKFGWVGGPASLQAIYILLTREQASAPRSGAQPMI